MEEFRESIRKMAQKGENEKAIQLINDRLTEAINENKYKLLSLKANILLLMGEYETSISLSRETINKIDKYSERELYLELKLIIASGLNINGKYNAAWDELYPILRELPPLEKISNDKELELIASIYNRLATIKVNKGDFDNGITYLTKSLNLRKKVGDKKKIGDTMYNLGSTYFQKGDLENAQIYLSQTLNLFKELGIDRGIAFAKMELGGVFRQLGRLSEALDYFLESNELFEKFGNEQQIAWTYTDLGNIYQDLGEISKSLNYYKKALPLYEKFSDDRTYANHIRTMAGAFEKQGEYDKAKNMYLQSLQIYKEIGNKSYQARAHLALGKIYHSIGEYDNSWDHLQTAESIFSEEENNDRVARVYFYQIMIKLQEQEYDNAKKFYNKLHQMKNKVESGLLNQISDLAHSLILRTENRLIQAGMSQKLVRKIIEEDIKNIDITSNAGFALVESLLLEYDLFKTDKVKREIADTLSDLYKTADKQHSIPLRIKTNILETQLFLLERDIVKAKKVLHDQFEIAKTRGYTHLQKTISILLDNITAREEELIQLFESGETDRILEITGLKNFLSNLVANKQMDLNITEDSPVYFSIITTGGLSIYSKNMTEKITLEDQLISGFLSAISSFTKELFRMENHSIEQMKVGDFFLIVQRISNYALAYVYEGSSHFARYKLSQIKEKFLNDNYFINELSKAEKKSSVIEDEKFDNYIQSVITH